MIKFVLLQIIAVNNVDYFLRCILLAGKLILRLELWVQKLLQKLYQGLQAFDEAAVEVALFHFLHRVEINEPDGTIIFCRVIVDADEYTSSFDVEGPIPSLRHVILQAIEEFRTLLHCLYVQLKTVCGASHEYGLYVLSGLLPILVGIFVVPLLKFAGL